MAQSLSGGAMSDPATPPCFHLSELGEFQPLLPRLGGRGTGRGQKRCGEQNPEAPPGDDLPLREKKINCQQ